MLTKTIIKNKFEVLEENTVSDSFGGNSLEGRAPDFNFVPIMDQIYENYLDLDIALVKATKLIEEKVGREISKYIYRSAGRFSFCIELTNLKITSTKMKTRWMKGKIMKTKKDSFQNYEGDFAPLDDQRSSSFEECYEIFEYLIGILSKSDEHLSVMKKLSNQLSRGLPYESVFGYLKYDLLRIHTKDNVSLVDLIDISWLIKVRPIIYPALRGFKKNKLLSKVVEKIKTKAYKTDRSQTGEVQTNRAKRWECILEDFQRATIEQCWSVERKLLFDLTGFKGFPNDLKQKLIDKNVEVKESTLCPVTKSELLFDDFMNLRIHGESKFQVGHLLPLKNGGKHEGGNIAWISDDGNRIQGSLTIEETHEMIRMIAYRLNSN